MTVLDNPQDLKKLDKSDVASSIAKLPDQIEQAWGESTKVTFPDEYKNIENIVVAGMGGSALGPELIRDVYKSELKVPFAISRDYKLPSFVGKNTLVVLSSYSGETEEVLSVADEAVSTGSKIVGITKGGKLGILLKEKGLPAYIFDPKHNPSGQPRIGLGYSIGGLLGLFKSLSLIKIEEKEVLDILSSLKDLNSSFSPRTLISENFTKEIAEKLSGSTVAVVGAEFLSANAHIFANQLNETSKTFSSYYLISELNHHLLEGLARPENLGKSLKFLILESDQYSEKIKKRIEITKDVIEKQKVETISIKFEEGSHLNQTLDGILISSYITFYLGILNGFDPSEVPWVDYFKEQLTKD
ncbi:bifunctional phosphoglucose/phosphomannose isomerase [Patescibacteria group bacterium]|nr:bifunctional phosphoglucose/phosphomannose isomerase [Patescibacteria group bacterium]